MFLALHLVGDLDGEEAVEVIQRDKMAWIQWFKKLGQGRAERAEDIETERYEMSLLYDLLAWATGGRNLQRGFNNVCLPATKVFQKFGHLLDVKAVERTIFGHFNEQKMREALTSSKAFESEILVVELKRVLPYIVPIGFPDNVMIPAVVVHGMEYRRVKDALDFL